MKLSMTQIAYHLTLTKGTVNDNGTVEFITIPLLCLTGLIFRLYQLAEMTRPIRNGLSTITERVTIWTKCFSVGFNTLAFALG